MVRPALLPAALVGLVVLAGCSTTIPGLDPEPTPADVEPELLDTNSTGGTCVEHPMNGFVVESAPNDDGTRTVSVAANVTVPGAHHVVDEFSLTRSGENAYRLDVNTTTDPQKPENPCENGGVAHYEATILIPDTDSVEFQIWHDGRHISGFGAGSET